MMASLQAVAKRRKVDELETRRRRLELIDRLTRRFRAQKPRQVSALPEELIHEDRDR